MKFTKPPEKPPINVAIIGPEKMGKSVGASTAPPPVLYLNFDTPNATRHVHQLRGDNVSEPYLPPYESGKNPVWDLMGEVSAMAYDPDCPFPSVVVDPVGDLHRRLMEEFSNRAVRPTLPTYGDVGVYIERFCLHLIESPLNAIFVMHDLPVKDEATGEIERLAFTGTSNPTLGKKICQKVDIVTHVGAVTTDDGIEWVAQTRPGKGRRAGDRFNVVPPLGPLDIGAWVEQITAAEQNISHTEPEATPAETPATEPEKEPAAA